MDVRFDGQPSPFMPWRPEMGVVFRGRFAFDTATTLIDPDRPWATPTFVLGAAFDGHHGYFVTPDYLADFLRVHRYVPVVFHDAALNLAVIAQAAPTPDIYDRVDRNSIWDTQILHRLLELGVAGTVPETDATTLPKCVEADLHTALPQHAVDEQDKLIRSSFGQWLNRPPNTIDEAYLDFLGRNAIAIWRLHGVLKGRLMDLLINSHKAWGFVSPGWLSRAILRWGPQTHFIQLRAAIVLRTITANGLYLDQARRDELLPALNAVLDQQLQELARHGYTPGQSDTSAALQNVFSELQRQYSNTWFPKTSNGQFATGQDELQGLTSTFPFIKTFLDYRQTLYLRDLFTRRMDVPVLHPSFEVLVRTGRTASFGDINAQNIPADDRIRSCFVPSPGYVYIDADYKAIEMVTLARVCQAQFRLDSKMAEAINTGSDLHTLVAAQVTGKPPAEITTEERKAAKPINFGKPGGMGDTALQQYARTSYGVELTAEQVKDFTGVWFDLFPEMREFLTDENVVGAEIAKLFELTPISHFDYTGDGRFYKHRDNIFRATKPHPILGSMCLKVLQTAEPQTANDQLYPPTDIAYFWNQVEAHIDKLPQTIHHAIRQHQPSDRLKKAVLALVGNSGVFTLTGRLRADAAYCARHNAVFQGLAADGAKLALWLLWRAGYRIVNFVHDQILVEVPDGSDLTAHAETVRSLMIEGMELVVQGVRVEVTLAATERWHKDAEAVYDAAGHLQVWQPTPAAAATIETAGGVA